jgi:hypothetical protein
VAYAIKALFAGLLMVLLFAVPSYAAGLDKANDLIGQANAIETKTHALDAQAGEQIRKALAIDPASKRATDALPLLAEAQTILARMIQNKQSVAALWDQVASLGVSREATTYASQMKDIAETYLQYLGVTRDLLTRYQTLYDRNKLSKLSGAELRKLDQEFSDLKARSGELDARIIQKQQSTQQYFKEHDVGKAGAGGRKWGRLVASLIFDACSALACGILARRKNRRILAWGAFGLLVPIAALVAILAVRKIDLQPQSAPLLQPRV